MKALKGNQRNHQREKNSEEGHGCLCQILLVVETCDYRARSLSTLACIPAEDFNLLHTLRVYCSGPKDARYRN